MENETPFDNIFIFLVEESEEDEKSIYNTISQIENTNIRIFNSPGLHDISVSNAIVSDIFLIGFHADEDAFFERLGQIQNLYREKAFIVLTSTDDIAFSERAVHNGIQDVLPKQKITASLLSRSIRHALARKRLEQELKQATFKIQINEMRLRRVVEQNKDTVIIVDNQGFIRYANPAAQHLWGIYHKNLTGYEFGSPTKVDHFTEIEIRHTGGYSVYAEMLASQIVWEGEPAHLISLRNISKKKKLNDEIHRSMKLEAMAHFSEGISHDFNALLGTINDNLQLAANQVQSGEPVHRWLTRAENACAKAQSQSDLLLNFSKHEGPVKERVSLKSLFDFPGWIKPEYYNISTSFDIPPDVWEIEVEVDSIREALKYVFDNSGEAMPTGGHIGVQVENITAGSHQVPVLKKGNYVKITITDEGSGIPKKNIINIFDPYFSTKPGNIGLGLSLAYSIIKKHEGFISAQSDVSRGTTVHVYLPV